MSAVRVLVAGLLAAACTDVDTSPNVATSIEFPALPFPAVVAGDTLRDTSGVAAPLRAMVFNSDNEEIVDAPMRYAALEAVVTVDSVTGVLVAGSAADTSARLVAYVGSLQAPSLRLSVVPRPDSVGPSGTSDTLRYSVIDTTRNLSGELAVRVVHRGDTADVPVRDWIVTFTLQDPADSVRARIVGDNQRPSAVDTTSAAGVAARKVRLLPAGLTSPRDSIVVLARVRYRGTHVAGSPLRLVLPVVPRVP
ncbi:MAG: hypothetical protein WEA80_04275 [Gemmatimonadaceae bacterium]